jgi:hypothetical protein
MTPLPVFADQFAWSIVLINTMHGGGYPSSLTPPLPVKAAGLTTSSETASGNEIFSINLYNPRLTKDFLTPGILYPTQQLYICLPNSCKSKNNVRHEQQKWS